MIRYKNFDGKQVSVAWHRVLTKMRQNGVPFTVVSGHRTMAEQWRLYRLWKAGRGNLAAFPSPTAPHIRTGRADHAIDFGRSDTEVNRVQRYLDSRGLKARETVIGEWWHVEVDGAALKDLARRID